MRVDIRKIIKLASINSLHLRFASLKTYLKYRDIRRRFDQELDKFSRELGPSLEGTVLVDALFANPSYWFLYAILRAALGFSGGQEIGLLGEFSRAIQKDTLKNFGIDTICDLEDSELDKNESLARETYNSLMQGEDLLELELPFSFPNEILYDYIIKSQKYPYIKINDPRLEMLISRFFRYLFASNRVMKKYKPNYLVCSHPNSIFSTIIWAALTNNVTVFVIDSEFNYIRIWRLDNKEKIYDFGDRVKQKYFGILSDQQKQKLEKIGEEYLEKRLSGAVDNLGAYYAFGIRRTMAERGALQKEFGWRDDKKVVAVYASNWFDYPHLYGMSHFKNLLDWIRATFEIAKENREVNWLFKNHPANDWYGGPSLEDFLDFENHDHIKLVPGEWNGASVMELVDAIITCHGTIGIEATSRGIPVLVADRGWYDDWNFVRTSSTRADYLELLRTPWWNNMNMELSAKLARIFSGLFWGRPAWQGDFVLPESAQQWKNYHTLMELFNKNKNILVKEIENIRLWTKSNNTHYHSYKMLAADDYVV